MNYLKTALVAVWLAGAGSAIAAGGDRIMPITAPANAPGNVRTDTCARPVYPEQELKQNHQGTVTMRFLLSTEGKVKQSLVVTSSGYPALDEAALVAISKCSFNPAMVDGKPVEVWTAIQYVWTP